MLEVSESPDKPVIEDTIIRDVVVGAIRTGLIKNAESIVSTWHRRLEYGYPTPFLNRELMCAPLFKTLESMSIYSRGRFGAWKYEVSNQDHSLMQGVEIIDRLVGLASSEPTFTTPSLVNKSNTNAHSHWYGV